jgi:creatinine amidohydrolase
MTTEIFLDKMTWPEIQERVKESDIAIVVIGCTEQHGPHLPLGTDSLEVWTITTRAAMKVAEEVKPVIAPLIPYGPNPGSIRNMPGTIHVRAEVMKEFVKDVCRSLIRTGFRKILIMNGCGTHYMFTDLAIEELADEIEDKVILLSIRWYNEFGIDIIEKETETHGICHADEAETSIAWACGAQVRIEEIEKLPPLKGIAGYPLRPPSYVKAIGGRIKPYTDDLQTIKSNTRGAMGIYGDPRKASKEKGERILNAIIERLADLLKELKVQALC